MNSKQSGAAGTPGKNDKPLRILRLSVSNVMRIKSAECEPSRGLVPVKGKNGSGKSSLLTAIDIATRGAKAAPPKTLRAGENHGSITIDLGAYVIKVSVTEHGEYWTMQTAAGDPVKKPMELLETLRASCAGDPLAFMRATAKEQRELLMQAVGLDFSEVDAIRKSKFDERTAVNRDAKRQESIAAGLRQDWPDDLPEAEQNQSQVIDEYREARDARAAVKDAANRCEVIRGQLATLRELLARTQRQIADAEADLAGQEAIANVKVPGEQQVANLLEKSRRIEETNRMVRARQAWKEAYQQQIKFEAMSTALTETITHIDEEKARTLAEVKMPVAGLVVTENGLELDGIPFSQASHARQIIASVAILLAQNPRLPILRVADASTLDADSMAILARTAQERGAQVFAEIVDDSVPGGIIVTDGYASDDNQTN